MFLIELFRLQNAKKVFKKVATFQEAVTSHFKDIWKNSNAN